MRIQKKIGEVAVGVQFWFLNNTLQKKGYQVADVLDERVAYWSPNGFQAGVSPADALVEAELTFADLDKGDFFIIDSDDCLDCDRGALYQKTARTTFRNIFIIQTHLRSMQNRDAKMNHLVTRVQVSIGHES